MAIGEYIVLDIETTGLSKYRHKITEIAAVKVNNGKIIDEWQALINPGCKIPSFITRLTGISNDMVKHSPPIEKLLPHFLDFLGDSPIVAHNATFDYGFITVNSEEHLGKSLENDSLCTRKLAHRILPDVGSKKLGCLCEKFGIVNQQAHRAMADVLATHELFLKFLDRMNDAGFETYDHVKKLECTPAAKLREHFE